MSRLGSLLRRTRISNTAQIATSSTASNASRTKLPYPESHYYTNAKIGSVLKERYKIINKIGNGQYSTVWLAEDVWNKRDMAVKILATDISSDETGWDEPGILRYSRDKNPAAQGYGHICHLVDNFAIAGEEKGEHICLVTELMGPTVQEIFSATKANLPLELVKRIAKHLLLALQYLHEECDIIHTDIKGDNIFTEIKSAKEDKGAVEVDYPNLMNSVFRLGDFGSANWLSRQHAEFIQPIPLRCPEAIIGDSWGTPVDIWNFGCLMYEFARGTKLFDPWWNNEGSGLNPPQTHLAQIVGLLGDFPKEFLTRSEFGDRFFDDAGRLFCGLGIYDATLEKLLLQRVDGEKGDIQQFCDFIGQALTIDPLIRPSASKLLQHMWLTDVSS